MRLPATRPIRRAVPATSSSTPLTGGGMAADSASQARSMSSARSTKKPLTPAQRRDKTVRRWFRTRIDVAGRVLGEVLEPREYEVLNVVPGVFTPFGDNLGHYAHEVRVHYARPYGMVGGFGDEVDYSNFEFPHSAPD